MIDKNWIDKKIDYLNQTMGFFKFSSEDFLFEPTNKFYSELEFGIIPSLEETLKMIDRGQAAIIPPNIQEGVNKIAKHIGLTVTPKVDYDSILGSGLFVGTKHTAAEIKGSAIKVSSIYEKKSKALGAILAHEITHFVLHTKGVNLTNTDENECLTDLASIMLGLGKLILNGKEERTTYSVSTLGYLSFSELAYAYEEQNAIRRVAPNICLSNLTDEASAQVRPLLWQREQEWKKDQGKMSALLRGCLGSFKLIEKIEKLYQRLVENQRWINENIHNVKIVDTQGNIFVQLNNYIFEQHFNIFIQFEKDKLADIS